MAPTYIEEFQNNRKGTFWLRYERGGKEFKPFYNIKYSWKKIPTKDPNRKGVFPVTLIELNSLGEVVKTHVYTTRNSTEEARRVAYDLIVAHAQRSGELTGLRKIIDNTSLG